jgi:hypothetical protein
MGKDQGFSPVQFAALLAKKPAEASNPGPINAYIWNSWSVFDAMGRHG